MGSKAWFVAYYNINPTETLAKAPQLDRDKSIALVNRLLPGISLLELKDGSLDLLDPTKKEVFVGVYGDLKIVAHENLSGDFPSRIDPKWYDRDLAETAYVHATHSVVDWCAFALWKKGELVRSVGVSPDSGVQENIGPKLPFEEPFWAGSFALEDEEDYPLPFHPLEFAEAGLLAMLGFQFEGNPHDWECRPTDIPIMRFRITKVPWWKFW